MNRPMRNLIPLAYGLLIIVGFIIATGMGIFVIIVGGVFSAVLWTALSRPQPGTAPPSPRGDREDRAAERAERRSDRRS
jgi:hypothetical protein